MGGLHCGLQKFQLLDVGLKSLTVLKISFPLPPPPKKKTVTWYVGYQAKREAQHQNNFPGPWSHFGLTMG